VGAISDFVVVPGGVGGRGLLGSLEWQLGRWCLAGKDVKQRGRSRQTGPGAQ